MQIRCKSLHAVRLPPVTPISHFRSSKARLIAFDCIRIHWEYSLQAEGHKFKSCTGHQKFPGQTLVVWPFLHPDQQRDLHFTNKAERERRSVKHERPCCERHRGSSFPQRAKSAAKRAENSARCNRHTICNTRSCNPRGGSSIFLSCLTTDIHAP